MNIENEVVLILSSGLSENSKVNLITNFTNFKREDIISALSYRFNKISKTYEKLIYLDKHGSKYI